MPWIKKNNFPLFDLPPKYRSRSYVRLRLGQKEKEWAGNATQQNRSSACLEADVLQGQGMTIGEISRKLGITEQTYYRWRKEYGGMRIDQAKRLKELEKENVRLKKIVANLSLDNDILKETVRGNF